MSFVPHTLTPAILRPTGYLRSGIYALDDITITLDGTDCPADVRLGATLQGRGDTGANPQGKELVDERWLELNDGSGWTPVGGGPNGDTLAVAGAGTIQARLNVPVGVATTGDMVANLELFYVE